jgi:hypothetical protein
VVKASRDLAERARFGIASDAAIAHGNAMRITLRLLIRRHVGIG